MRDGLPDSAAGDGNVQQVGAFLRETREARGLTLDEAARVTRIGKNYLAAIEEGMFDKLPNVAYAKGFLRNYASYLGLSGEEMVARYEQALAPGRVRPVERSGRGDEARPAADWSDRRAASRGRWYASLVLLVLVMAVAYCFKGEEEQPSLLPPAPPQSRQAVAIPPVQPRSSSAALPGRTAAATVPASRQDEPAPATTDLPPGGIVLRLKVNQDSWLNITIDGDITQQYDLKAGDLIEWKGEKFFTLDLGNAGGIEAEFNGKPLKSLGEPGKAAHLVLRGDTPGGTESTREKPAP